MSIEVFRAPHTAPAGQPAIWEVRLMLVPGAPVPQGWDARCLRYRFDTRAAAEAFARLKIDSSIPSQDHGLLSISSSSEGW